LTLSLALRMPGTKPHTAPAAIPARAMAVSIKTAGVSGGSKGVKTTALAAKAPMKSCPSAPIFHSFIRKATVQASPVRMMGVALTSVSENTPVLPKEALAMWA
jgi:hypothetical protein